MEDCEDVKGMEKKYDGGFVALGLEDGFEGGHEMVEELVRIALHVGIDHHGSKQSVWKIRQIFREGHFGKNLLEHVKHRRLIGCFGTHSTNELEQ